MIYSPRALPKGCALRQGTNKSHNPSLQADNFYINIIILQADIFNLNILQTAVDKRDLII